MLYEFNPSAYDSQGLFPVKLPEINPCKLKGNGLLYLQQVEAVPAQGCDCGAGELVHH
jgi:hypothetical protein